LELKVQIAIFGYGKIGRALHKALARPEALASTNIKLVAIGDRRLSAGFALQPSSTSVQLVTASERRRLPWHDLGVDLVVDATGAARSREEAFEHIASGAKQVVVSQSLSDADVVLISGVNDSAYNPSKHQVISSSSCTAVVFSPVMQTLISAGFPIESVTVDLWHGYNPTRIDSDVDLSRVSWFDRRRLSSGATVPYQTNFAKNVVSVLPFFEGKLSASGSYAPFPQVLMFLAHMRMQSAVGLVDVLRSLYRASQNEMSGIIDFSMEKDVSVVANNGHAAIIFPILSMADQGMISLAFAGDYIAGYAQRLAALLKHIDSTKTDQS
jgi:glyceraldehyde 3-phosphate dehydrogenase